MVSRYRPQTPTSASLDTLLPSYCWERLSREGIWRSYSKVDGMTTELTHAFNKEHDTKESLHLHG